MISSKRMLAIILMAAAPVLLTSCSDTSTSPQEPMHMSMGQGAHIATTTTLHWSRLQIDPGQTVNLDAETTSESGSIKKCTLQIEIAVDASGSYTSVENAVDWVTYGTPSTGTTCAATFTPSAAGKYGFRATFDPKGAKFQASTSTSFNIDVSINSGGDGGAII